MITFEEFLIEQNFNTVLGSSLSNVPGQTTRQKLDFALDMLNTVLDSAGIADPSGLTDGINSVIYVLRSFAAKDSDERNKHLFDSLISLVSAMPFGDLAKLLRARKMRTSANVVDRIGGPMKTVAHSLRAARQ